jgi:hypothetical protein
MRKTMTKPQFLVGSSLMGCIDGVAAVCMSSDEGLLRSNGVGGGEAQVLD